MNKITFPRTDVDGISHTKEQFLNFYCGKIEKNIRDRLQEIKFRKPKEKAIIIDIIASLHDILIAPPSQLNKYASHYRMMFRGVASSRQGKVRGQIAAAFNYDNYRKTVLVAIAKMLNIKTCPYCNMHYTLYAEEGTRAVDRLARLQFDHFIDKSKHPMLSMSFFNLIPSCAVCNQGKSKTPLPGKFNPYSHAIASAFRFEVDDPVIFFAGSSAKDVVDINLAPKIGYSKQDIDDYNSVFHLKALYGRHKDIVNETFDKAYTESYYCNPSTHFSRLGADAQAYIEKLWYGVSLSENDIETRPMSKFIIDMRHQALIEKANGLKI